MDVELLLEIRALLHASKLPEALAATVELDEELTAIGAHLWCPVEPEPDLGEYELEEPEVRTTGVSAMPLSVVPSLSFCVDALVRKRRQT